MYERREDDLAITSQRVIDKMENNPFFTEPPAALTKLKKAAPEFQTALSNALSRDKHLVAIKNDLKALILLLLKEVADYVTKICKGDKIMILSSGFDVNKDPRKTWIAPAIEILEVELGGPGIATTLAKNVSGVKGYVHQYTTEQPGPNTQWITEGSSSKSYTFTGLQSEKRYWFRVMGIGTRKRRTYSPVITVVIQ